MSLSFHTGSPYSYIIWGVKNRRVGGRSSETVSPHLHEQQQQQDGVKKWQRGVQVVSIKRKIIIVACRIINNLLDRKREGKMELGRPVH
jgi:hypothetical protein